MPDDPARTEYTFLRRGATTGAVTGKRRTWQAGGVITAPQGEFAHISSSMYTARVIDTSRPAPTPSGTASVRYQVGEKTHNGWWPVIDTQTGEQVDGESERDRETAQANADRLNAQT